MNGNNNGGMGFFQLVMAIVVALLIFGIIG